MKSLSRVRLPATPWTAAHQAPSSMGFSKQEYWSGVPLPSPFGSLVGPKNWVDIKWDYRGKAYTFYWIIYISREPSQENENPKKWLEREAFITFRQRNNKSLKNWQDKGICSKCSKWWRSNWKNKGEMDNVCSYKCPSVFMGNWFQDPCRHQNLWQLKFLIKMV